MNLQTDANTWEGEAVIKCKHCKAEKLESEMSVWAGKPSKVCIDCKAKHPTGGAARSKKSGGGGDTSKKRKAAARRPKRAAAKPELRLLPGGFGCTARITDEGYLQLTQENDGSKPDNVCLTAHEAKAIFDEYGEWIVAGAK